MNTPGMRARIGTMAIGLLGVWSVADGKVIYVAKTGSDANDGLSWATAKVTVWAGTGAAKAGDEVWVAAGTYVECVLLTSGAALYGGFAGHETDLAQRDWRANATILDGNARGSVVTLPSGASSATRIDGFIIRNGKAENGGGIRCGDNSSPTISNNTITNNNAYPGYGGGIYCSYRFPTITSNTITGNSAYYGGGGVYCSNSSPTIANNTITDNSTYSGGSPSRGGGVGCSGGSPTIINNTITSNRSYEKGGGISCYYSSATITHNTITGNSAYGIYGGGGGIRCEGASPTIANNKITGNSASRDGGGISCSGSATMANNTIAGNNALSGGGLYCSGSPTITNTIVAFNSSGIDVYSGSGSVAPVLRYNCVHGNTGHDYSGVTDPTGIDGNISADPRLAHTSYGNAHIQPDSPCKDAGDDTQVQADGRDIDGQARIQGAHVDIGADESDGTVWPAGPCVVVRVSLNGDDANDGSSWASAKRTVQAAIDLAGILGGEVWVRAGTYRERITLYPHAYLYGGFAGTEDSRDQRDWKRHVTILDGQAAGTVVSIRAGWQVSTIDGFTIRNGKTTYYGGGIRCYEGASPIITNNTITGNISVWTQDPNSSGGAGGGICCGNYSAPTITNNTITGNNSVNWARGPMGGGGIYCGYFSSPMIANNTITGNSSFGLNCGGGISCESNSSPTIVNTIIAFNTSGIYRRSSSATPLLRYNCVYGNTAYNYSSDLTDPTGSDGNISADPKLAWVAYGNVHIQPDSPCKDAGDDAQVEADGRDFDGQARMQGTHVDIGADESDGMIWPAGPYVIVRVSPNGNDANDGSSWTLAKGTVQAGIDLAGALGGEVWVQAGIYQERIFLHPYAYVYGGFAGTEDSRDQRHWTTQATILDGQSAGAVVVVQAGEQVSAIDGFTIRNGTGNASPYHYLYGGGILCYGSSPTITNNMITGNGCSNGVGAGIGCVYSSPRIVNNTITGNEGGGIYGDTGSPTIINTIVAFNSSGIFLWPVTGSAAPVLRNNCVYGNAAYNYSGKLTDLTGTDGNISVDPKLGGLAYGDVHIQPDSPCKDAGDDAQVQADWRDIDGQDRIQGNHVDIGADESDGTDWPAGPYVIVRVSPNGDDANDGSSWTSAKRTVQAGIDLAGKLGGEVWVQAGVYKERITLASHAHVYGGFAGTEDSRDERHWRTQATILDGQAAGPVVSIRAGWQVSRIDGFTIRNGNASTGGGIYCDGGSATIVHNTITGNTATKSGGGIYCISGSKPTITHNTITANHATEGGGVYCDYASPTIANNTITGNAGSGISCSGSSATIANNTITGNAGGGISCSGSSLTIINTIIAFNSSGVYKTGSDVPVLRNNCVYGNTAYNYSNLTDPTGTDGNISVDPSFVRAPSAGTDGQWATADDDLGDLHLKAGSPCIDAGENWSVPTGILTDLDGLLRFVNDPATPDTGRGTAPIVDIGAYEYVPGDLDHDGDSDADDLTVFAACVSGPAVPCSSDCAKADFDRDGDVDQSDFGLLQRWLSGAKK